MSRVDYDSFAGSDTFRITPDDGTVRGPPARVTLRAESLPAGSADVIPDRSDVRDWQALHVTSGFGLTEYSETFPAPNYPVSAILLGSRNMEGLDLGLDTRSGDTHTASVPSNGTRMIELDPALRIRSVTLSADGVAEEPSQDLDADVRMFVGYVPGSCTDSPLPCSSDAQYRAVSGSDIPIPDNGGGASSTMGVPVNGVAGSLSVSVDIDHTRTGDLTVSLVSPDGTEAVLRDRQGGRSHIAETYRSQANAELAGLLDTPIRGDWTLSVEDHASGHAGTVNGWDMDFAYAVIPDDAAWPEGSIAFFDNFQSGLSKWTEEGGRSWDDGSFDEDDVPGHPQDNRVAEADRCRSECRLVMSDAIDLRPYDNATLSFYRYVDEALDPGDYLKVDLYDGAAWNTAFDWQGGTDDDSTWYWETLDLSEYLDAGGFKVRFVARADGSSEDLGIDDVVIAGGRGTNGPPEIGTIQPQSVREGSTLSVDVTSTDPDGDSLTLSAPGLPSFAMFSDGGDGTGTFTFRPGYQDSGRYTITVTASDWAESDSESFMLIVINAGGGPSPPPPSPDTTAPAVTAPADVTAEATGALTAVSIGQATATDNRDPRPEVTNDAPASFPLGDTTVTWTATDGSGNSSTATQTVTVRDTTPPTVTAPAAYTAEATGAMTELDAGDYGTATATDLVDPDPEIISDAPASFPLGATTVTWTATDGSGNSAEATQTVTVRDTTPPTVTAPAGHTAEATGTLTPLDAGDYGTATAADLADPDPEITSNAPASFPLGGTVITWTATDGSGNSATAAQTVTVRDTTPPVIQTMQDIEVIVPPDVNATVYFAVPEATDLADPDVAVSCAPASGSEFPAGSTAVTCTATDRSGNESSASFDVLVTPAAGQDVLLFDFESGRLDGWTKSGVQRWHADRPAERIQPPGSPLHNRVAEADGCSTECIMTLTSPVDLTPYHSEELTFYRYVDYDLDGSEYLRLDAFNGYSWEELGRWTPEDSDDDSRWHLERYALDAYADSDVFKIRFAARMDSFQEQVAVDDIMITAVRAADTAPPTVTAPPDVTFEATAPLTPLDSGDYGTATASDGSGAPPEVTSDAPASFPVGDTVITWTATDASGNAADAVQTITVRDTTPPAFTQVPGDLAVLTHHGRDAEAAFAAPEAEDIADPDAAVSCAPESGSGFPVGSTTVTCTATDSSGNESSASFEVRVGQYEATATVSRTVTGEGARWTVSGPAAVFAGETYEYTVTRESGSRPLNEALAIYSDTSTVDDFGQYSDGADCAVSFCAGFPGQAGDSYELDNHGGSAYDIRYRAIGAAGPGHVIELQVGDSAQAGAGVTVGLMDRHGGPRGGVQVTVADPASVSTLDRRLVSHLAFEGDVRDSAGSSHGAVNGTESYVDGVAGRAFYFDGSTYVALANEERFDFGLDDPFGISFWFHKDGPDDFPTSVLTKARLRTEPGLSAYIWEGVPTRIHFGIDDETAHMGINTDRAANLTDGTWRHVAFTYDGSGLRDGLAAYVDGTEGSDRRMALSLNGTSTNDAPLTLGATGAGTELSVGLAIDELRVYSRELTAREVFELYAAGTG